MKTRSKCLSEQALFPIIDKIPGLKQSPQKVLRIADLGGGSGDLTKEIFENLFSSHSELSKLLRIALTVVDYDFPDMTRHLKNTKFYRSLASLKCKRMNFLDWIHEKSIGSCKPEVEVVMDLSDQQRAKPFDLVFMFRLLNNMSEFGIEHTGDWSTIQTIVCEKISRDDWSTDIFYPHHAIQAGQIEKIVLSTKQISLASGVIWCLSSLSDYFRALHCLSKENKTDHPEKSGNEIFFPVRKLNLDRIQYESGRNLFVDLCRLCHFVLIEDIDLKSSDLRRHLLQQGLSKIKVIDLPSRIPSSHTLCVFEDQ